MADRQFNDRHRLAAVNSINWARILTQTVYYFSSYFQLQSQLPSGTEIDSLDLQYVVPTGNFGDVLAGYFAKRMGLPMGKLVVATNENDILTRFWKSGRYEKIDSTTSGSDLKGNGSAESGVKATLSPAMDVLVSSNFERLLWYLAYGDASAGGEEERREAAGHVVANWMGSMKADGRVEIPIQILQNARKDFIAERLSDQEVHCSSLPAVRF